MKGRLLSVTNRCRERRRRHQPQRSNPVPSSSSAPSPPVSFVVFESTPQAEEEKRYLDVDRGTFHGSLQCNSQDHGVLPEIVPPPAQGVGEVAVAETTMLTGGTTSVTTTTGTTSHHLDDEEEETTAAAAETATTSSVVRSASSTSNSDTTTSSKDEANARWYEERSNSGDTEHQDVDGRDNIDNSSFATLSTKDMHHNASSLSPPVSPVDKAEHKEEDSVHDHLLLNSMTQGELSAHTTLSLVEAMEKGDDRYFTEGFVSVGELPCI